MSERMPNTGIIRLEPEESLSTDDYAFQSENPRIIDRLAWIGAVTHKHDGHARMADPAQAPVVATVDLGGTLPSDTTIYVTYTLVDNTGGESLPVAAVLVTTQAGLVVPEIGPTLALDTTAGGLLAGNYSYAVTVTDGAGGETILGPAVDIDIPPGNAFAQVVISDLASVVADAGGSGWRLWRMIDGGGWYLVTFGAADTVTDDGTLCPDCTGRPPLTTSRTNSTSKLHVTVPPGQPVEAVSFRLYASTSVDGGFVSPAMLGEFPVADLGTQKEFTSLNLQDGRPPVVATTLPGAAPLTLDDTNLTWRAPVATATDLPATGNTDGDVRLTLDDHALHAWNEPTTTWVAISGGGGVGIVGVAVSDHDNPAYPVRSVMDFTGDLHWATDDPDNDRVILNSLSTVEFGTKVNGLASPTPPKGGWLPLTPTAGAVSDVATLDGGGNRIYAVPGVMLGSDGFVHMRGRIEIVTPGGGLFEQLPSLYWPHNVVYVSVHAGAEVPAGLRIAPDGIVTLDDPSVAVGSQYSLEGFSYESEIGGKISRIGTPIMANTEYRPDLVSAGTTWVDTNQCYHIQGTVYTYASLASVFSSSEMTLTAFSPLFGWRPENAPPGDWVTEVTWTIIDIYATDDAILLGESGTASLRNTIGFGGDENLALIAYDFTPQVTPPSGIDGLKTASTMRLDFNYFWQPTP